LSPILQRPSVEVLNWHALQINFFEAANIGRRHPITLGVDAFSIRVNAARPAKAVFDDVLAEGIRAEVSFRCAQVQLVARHKPQERSLAGTDRTIAGHCSVEVAFDLKRNLAAVTTAGILHVGSP
jgi:hypothetical protein